MKKLCTNCGHTGDTERITKGSMGIELILWLCFIIPGLIYSVWRLSSRHDACPVCGNAKMIPMTAPIAKKFIEANGLSAPVEPSRAPSARAKSIGYTLGAMWATLIPSKPN
jgi:hypothetical protein